MRTTAKALCRCIPLAWRQKVWEGWSGAGFWGVSVRGRVEKRQRTRRGACLPIQKETAQQQKRNILLHPPDSECVAHGPQMEERENRRTQGSWALNPRESRIDGWPASTGAHGIFLASCGILHCSAWTLLAVACVLSCSVACEILLPQPRIEPMSSALQVQFSRSTLCHPMDCGTPCFPVHHQLPELA